MEGSQATVKFRDLIQAQKEAQEQWYLSFSHHKSWGIYFPFLGKFSAKILQAAEHSYSHQIERRLWFSQKQEASWDVVPLVMGGLTGERVWSSLPRAKRWQGTPHFYTGLNTPETSYRDGHEPICTWVSAHPAPPPTDKGEMFNRLV